VTAAEQALLDQIRALDVVGPAAIEELRDALVSDRVAADPGEAPPPTEPGMQVRAWLGTYAPGADPADPGALNLDAPVSVLVWRHFTG
jgi:hypothetical protein